MVERQGGEREGEKQRQRDRETEPERERETDRVHTIKNRSKAG